MTEMVVGVLTIVAWSLLIVYRRPFGRAAAALQRAMYGSLGNRVARNMTPNAVIVVSIFGIVLGIILIVIGITGYEYSSLSTEQNGGRQS